jgi:hypothetical protein
MPRCCFSDHLAAQTPIALYLTYPGHQGDFTGDRYRLRCCVRHGHQLLVLLLKRGSNLLAEAELPEFCLGCAQPTSTSVYEARWYEGDWSVAATYSLCDDCAAHPLEALAEAPLTGEKLPPREKTPQGARRRR